MFVLYFQVYEEKEKMWERELRKIKGLYDNRLRASQQKSSKMEQALTNQTYQVGFQIVRSNLRPSKIRCMFCTFLNSNNLCNLQKCARNCYCNIDVTTKIICMCNLSGNNLYQM